MNSGATYTSLLPRLALLLDDVLGRDTGPALTAVVVEEGTPVLTVTARRDGHSYTAQLDLGTAATLTDGQLDHELRWMIGHAIDELDDPESEVGDS